MIGLYVDCRVGGVERWVYADPRDALMRVPDLVAHCPVFLTVKDRGRDKPAGTGCFLGVRTDARRDITHGYLVTAKHCIDRAKEIGPLSVRINRWAGEGGSKDLTTAEIIARAGDAELIETEYSGWRYHDDDANDVAVLPMAPPGNEFLFVLTERESMATADVIEKEAIGIGDDLIVVGLFSSHHGRSRNLPIVRAGIIAAMPQEPIEDQNSGELFDAYLAEVRSVGGLSGSPVWVVMNPARLKPGSGERERRLHFYLLGLIRGHWRRGDDWISDFDDADSEVGFLNTGIAMVTPIQKALTIIDSEELVKERKRIEREHHKPEGQQTEDSAIKNEAESSGYDRFEGLARRIVNVPKKEIDEKRKESD